MLTFLLNLHSLSSQSGNLHEWVINIVAQLDAIANIMWELTAFGGLPQTSGTTLAEGCQKPRRNNVPTLKFL